MAPPKVPEAMGSLIQFRGRQPKPAEPMPMTASQVESLEERKSLKILVWTFAFAAIAMCATVVFSLSPHGWLDLIWLVSFMIVFVLAKIGLAQVAFMIMMAADDESEARRINTPKQPTKLIPLNPERRRTKRVLTGTASSQNPTRRR